MIRKTRPLIGAYLVRSDGCGRIAHFETGSPFFRSRPASLERFDSSARNCFLSLRYGRSFEKTNSNTIRAYPSIRYAARFFPTDPFPRPIRQRCLTRPIPDPFRDRCGKRQSLL